ncbi:MAG TPA: tetratricopeptide repeat protein [Candidatus Polarisedimenticolia bacterium]
MSQARGWRSAGLVALVACIVNLGALAPGFIHDDHRIIEQNELVRGLSRSAEIMTHGYWSVGAVDLPILYRPVTILSFALNVALLGSGPLGFRAVNLALHALISILVLLLGRRVFGRAAAPALDAPLAAALLFAVHPIHTEVLGEVVGRAELLAAAGTLVSLLSFLESARRGAAGERGSAALLSGLSVAAFGAGFLAKENAVAAFFLGLLADRTIVRGRFAWRHHLAMGAMLLACLAARAEALGGLNPAGQIHFLDNPIAFAPFLTGRWTALAVAARYALLLVLPLRQSIDYSYNAIPIVSGFLDPAALCGAAVTAAALAGFILSWRRSPAIAFALGFMGLSFLPVANLLLPIGTIMAERLLYLPSIGFCLLAGSAVDRARAFDRAAAGRRRVLVAVPVVLLLFSARSMLRLREWRDDYTIFRSALVIVPDSVRALYNFGAACEDRGEDAGAERVYLRAVALWPDFADAQYNLAGVLSRRKAWEEAVAHYRDAVRLQPANVKYLVNLGRAQNGQGRPAEARDTLRRALEIDPRSAQGFTNLGAAELALEQPAAAVAAYAQAARLEPTDPDYQRNLALAQVETGDFAQAAATFRRGLALRPGDADLMMGLGLALLRGRETQGALDALQQAERARPSSPIARYQLGRALESAGRPEEAVVQYRESARLSPGSPVPWRALGMLLAKTGDRAGAEQALARAADLDPQGKVMDDAARRLLLSLRDRSGARR